MTDDKRTPLYDCHIAAGARMMPFGGWTMPVQYEGIIGEHHQTRQHVTIFDTCHMGQIRVDGAGAQTALSRLLTTRVEDLAEGRCRYGFMLNEDGGVVDDLITYRLGATEWLMVVNAGTKDGDLAWMQEQVGAEAGIKDVSADKGKIDVQGPESQQTLEVLLGVALSDLKYFAFKEVEAEGMPLLISRTGYTGEHGYEVYGANADIVTIWEQLVASGISPAGLGARDTLRLEAGLPLYGHELTPALGPVAAGLMRFASKEDEFLGRDAVERKQQNGVDHFLRGFKIEGRQSARHGQRLEQDGKDVGWVASGSFSPTLGYAIGFAYVTPHAAKAGNPVAVQTGRRALQAEWVEFPFYKRT